MPGSGKANTVYKERLSDSLELVLCFVEGTSFVMGNEDGYDDEKPEHQVSVGDYYIGKYPISQAIWSYVMGTSPSYFQGKCRPVEDISWEDTQAFFKRLNELTEGERPVGWVYRLPTEAEWEYAAGGGKYGRDAEGKRLRRYAGEEDLEEVGWYSKNSYEESKVIGKKYPNELGLYDMSGNVWEWCWDWHSDDYYAESKQQGLVQNPVGPDEGQFRVNRGGSWSLSADRSRVTYRLNWPPNDRDINLGFRPVLASQFIAG